MKTNLGVAQAFFVVVLTPSQQTQNNGDFFWFFDVQP